MGERASKLALPTGNYDPWIQVRIYAFNDKDGNGWLNLINKSMKKLPHTDLENAPKKGVLADHEKEGKKLIPPYVAALGRPEEVSWVYEIVPEVIWIGMASEKSERMYRSLDFRFAPFATYGVE